MRITSPLQKKISPQSSTFQAPSADGLLAVRKRQDSADGTRKLLLGLADGLTIETVIMPMPRTHTLCLSTQVGCPLGCTFCLTGQGGFVRNLSPEELAAQFRTAAKEARDFSGRWPTRAVFMGMGEPLLNFDALRRCLEVLTSTGVPRLSWRKIQVSTVGIPDRLEELGRSRLALPAISLHAPTQELRDRIMPGAKRWSLGELMQVLRRYPIPGRERIVIEYLLIRNFNDTDGHADQLCTLLAGVRAKVNLIPCNPVPGSPHVGPSPERVEGFGDRLKAQGLTAFVRRSLGPDILAACGQLRCEDERVQKQSGPPAAICGKERRP
jgi:23S rRNA (adenine2503-C2)-methyltransferase